MRRAVLASSHSPRTGALLLSMTTLSTTTTPTSITATGPHFASRGPSTASAAARRTLSPLYRATRSDTFCATVQCQQRRWQSSSGSNGVDGPDGGGSFLDEEDTGSLESELASVLEREGGLSVDAALARPLEKVEIPLSSPVRLEKLDRPPARFDLLTNSLAYRWQTTARLARKVCGPMREWAAELKYRTGCHVEMEPTHPSRLLLSESEGGYACADDVDITVYLFGSERGVFNCHRLMESIVERDPAYVRLGVFRRVPDKPGQVEWLMLRRINREMRPPDIPPISLKLPGKWTLLYEQYKEAAIRTLWEETGIAVEPANVFPTARLEQSNPVFYWRVPVHYFIAEVPHDAAVPGPQVVPNAYMHHWDPRLLRQSPDPIDRAWAQFADPETGCAWMEKGMIDELQRPLRGEGYMATRYTPPPYAKLAEVLGFEVPIVEGIREEEEISGDAGAAAAAVDEHEGSAASAGDSVGGARTATPSGESDADATEGESEGGAVAAEPKADATEDVKPEKKE